MSTELFPTLPGASWEVKMKDEFGTLIQKAAAPGFETRLLLGPDPLIHFELDFSWLRQKSYDAMVDELHRFRGFFRARHGDFESFLLSLPPFSENPDDGAVAGQALAPDANFIAPLVVTREGYDENIYEAAGVNGNPGVAPVVNNDGVPLTAGTDYNIVGPGYALDGVTYPGLAVQFLIDPTGFTMTADFSWYYRVRFEQSDQQFDKFLALLYSANKVQLVTTRT